jgi:hypothetical protein
LFFSGVGSAPSVARRPDEESKEEKKRKENQKREKERDKEILERIVMRGIKTPEMRSEIYVQVLRLTRRQTFGIIREEKVEQYGSCFFSSDFSFSFFVIRHVDDGENNFIYNQETEENKEIASDSINYQMLVNPDINSGVGGENMTVEEYLRMIRERAWFLLMVLCGAYLPGGLRKGRRSVYVSIAIIFMVNNCLLYCFS